MRIHLTISVPEDIIPKIDAYAKRKNLNRSAAICFMCSLVLEAEKQRDDSIDGLRRYMYGAMGLVCGEQV